MRAVTMLIVGMMVMPNYGLMGKKASAKEVGILARAPSAPSASNERRAIQQKIPGGLSPQEWDALNAETDRWQGSQPDGVMTVMELSGKYRTGQITKQEYDEGMDILQGATLSAPKRRK
jgi:hypothetical protein